METDYKKDMDALERACEEVLDAETLKAVVVAKRRIQGEPEREIVSRRSIKIPIEIVPTCNEAAMREALANLVDVIDRYDSGSPLWWHCGAKGVKPLKDAKAALSAPPRVCDVFADAPWDRISRAWQDWILAPENKHKIVSMKEFCYWFLGPAKEGAVQK